MAIIYQPLTMHQAHTELFIYSILFNQHQTWESRNFYYLYAIGKELEA